MAKLRGAYASLVRSAERGNFVMVLEKECARQVSLKAWRLFLDIVEVSYPLCTVRITYGQRMDFRRYLACTKDSPYFFKRAMEELVEARWIKKEEQGRAMYTISELPVTCRTGSEVTKLLKQERMTWVS